MVTSKQTHASPYFPLVISRESCDLMDSVRVIVLCTPSSRVYMVENEIQHVRWHICNFIVLAVLHVTWF
jgi:hypothetical protein